MPFHLRFHNGGKDALTILGVSTSCGCTQIDDLDRLTNLVVAPAQDVMISGTLDVGRNPGTKRSRLSVTCSRDRSFGTTLTAEVTPTWTLVPDAVDLGEISGSSGQLSQIVDFHSDSDALLAAANRSSDWLDVQLSADSVVLTAIPERMHHGHNSAVVEVETTCPGKPTGVLLVRARYHEELMPSPPIVVLKRWSPALVAVRGHADEIIRLMSAASDQPHVTATVIEPNYVRITLDPDANGSSPCSITVTDEVGRIAYIRAVPVNPLALTRGIP